MRSIVFCLEGPSDQEMLEGLLPRVLPPDIEPRYLIFKGKQHLEKNLVRKLRGWRRPECVFLVMRDQDSGDCCAIKQNLLGLCQKAGKGKKEVRVRIACRELESFYLGDLKAVEQGLGLTGLASQQATSKFRTPDSLVKPSQELGRLTKGKYQKLAGSRAIAAYLSLTDNKSRSFNYLIEGIRALAGPVH